MSKFHLHRARCGDRLVARLFNIVTACKYHAHAALAADFGFTEQAPLRVFLLEHVLQIAEAGLIGIALHQYHAAGTGSVKTDVRNRQVEYRTRVQCELCMAFNGRVECRVGQGQDRDAAIESARTNACAVMTGGVTDAFRCNATAPQSMSCKAL